MNLSVAILTFCGSLVKTPTEYSIFFAVTGVFGVFSYLLFFFKFDVVKENKIIDEDKVELKEVQ
jgi:hypothetical protein